MGFPRTERLHFHFSLWCIGEGNGNPLQCSCLENPRDGGAWWATVYGVAKSWTWLRDFHFYCLLVLTDFIGISMYFLPLVTLFGEGNGTPLQYSCLENPMDRGAWSMGSQRIIHDWATSLSPFTFMHWRRKWQSTPLFLPGESQRRGSLVGYRLWGCTELDTTEVT